MLTYTLQDWGLHTSFQRLIFQLCKSSTAKSIVVEAIRKGTRSRLVGWQCYALVCPSLRQHLVYQLNSLGKRAQGAFNLAYAVLFLCRGGNMWATERVDVVLVLKSSQTNTVFRRWKTLIASCGSHAPCFFTFLQLSIRAELASVIGRY